jgi:hypothetical protein
VEKSEKDHLKDQGEDGSVKSKGIVGRMWSGFIWLRIGIGGGLL